MKEPMMRGTPIDMKRMASWVSVFSGYRHSITEERIDRWLLQFDRGHRDLAARVLDCVDFVNHEHIAIAFRSILNSLDGWDIDESNRRGRWRFVAYSGSAGESGDSMLHRFRLATGLHNKKYNDLFIHRSELLRDNLGPSDNVVFIDDFAGTGKQVCDSWGALQELLPGNPIVYLVLIAASTPARKKIANETELAVVSDIELTDHDNIFSSTCSHFTASEKELLLRYCRKGDTRNPRGFGNCGFVIVFAHNCPNNSVPILHAYHPRWEGLFRRYD